MFGSAQRYRTFSTCLVHTLDDGLALIVLVRRHPGGGIDSMDCVASALAFYQLIDFATAAPTVFSRSMAAAFPYSQH